MLSPLFLVGFNGGRKLMDNEEGVKRIEIRFAFKMIKGAETSFIRAGQTVAVKSCGRAINEQVKQINWIDLMLY